MKTLQTAIAANTKNKESFTHDSPETYDNLYAKRDYGTLDYPVNARCLDLRKSYMNWIRWHWHEEMEIIIVNQGIAEVSTDDATYLIKPGQGLIVNQNVMHCIHAYNQKHCIFLSLVFHPDFIFGHKNNYLQTEYLLPMQNYQLFKAFFLDESAPWHERILQTLKEIIDLNLDQNFGYEIATKGYLCHFWVELLRQLPPTGHAHCFPRIAGRTARQRGNAVHSDPLCGTPDAAGNCWQHPRQQKRMLPLLCANPTDEPF